MNTISSATWFWEKCMPTENIIVTGAAGFIGFHLAKRLLDEGKPVHGLDNLNAYYDVTLKAERLFKLGEYKNFSFTQTDIADFDAVQELFATLKPCEVLHMAAQAGVRHSITHPQDYISANLDGFFSILEACRQNPVAHLLYASSSSVYGGNTKVPFSETDPVDSPVSLYAATKRANELMAHSYAHLYRIPMTGLRFFTVYGPWGRPDMALFLFARGILKNEPIPVYNYGKMSRDFTYIDDAVEAVVRLIKRAPDASKSAPHRVLNIGNQAPVEIESFIAVIEKLTGKKAVKAYEPLQPGDVPATYADVEALKKLTGFAPKTTLEEGIKAFLAWFRDYYKL
jgi:UDP-glucuronate 4-epimerase